MNDSPMSYPPFYSQWMILDGFALHITGLAVAFTRREGGKLAVAPLNLARWMKNDPDRGFQLPELISEIGAFYIDRIEDASLKEQVGDPSGS
ncbi:MAG: hypothetical protein PSY14_15710 [bacterium]|nr:hypothetical protein [bacterium]